MADTGWVSPGTATEYFCGGCTSWANDDNIKIQNDTYSESSMDKLDYTQYQSAENFTLGIPAGSTIDGIEVRYDGYVENSAIQEASIRLHKNGAPSGTDYGDDASIPTSDTDTYKVDGGPTDMWSSGYDYDDVTDSTFVFYLQMYNSDVVTTYDGYIDHMQIKVYYTPGYVNDVHDVPATNIA